MNILYNTNDLTYITYFDCIGYKSKKDIDIRTTCRGLFETKIGNKVLLHYPAQNGHVDITGKVIDIFDECICKFNDEPDIQYRVIKVRLSNTSILALEENNI